MKSYGATFTAPMILAALSGRKSMTRRVIEKIDMYKNIQPGDVLYFKECWALYQTVNYVKRPDGRAFSEVSDGKAAYKADGFDSIQDLKDHIRLMSDGSFEAIEVDNDRWKSGMFMPEWAARIRRTVVATWTEHIREITASHIRSEGVDWPCSVGTPLSVSANYHRAEIAFKALWDSINVKRGYSFESNPRVRVIEWRNEK